MLVLLVFVLVFAAGFGLPWWVMAAICFSAAAWRAQSGTQAFWSPLFSVFAAWVLLSIIQSAPNSHMLATRVAALFHLPNWMALMALTGFIGGLTGGFAGLSGYLVKRLFVSK